MFSVLAEVDVLLRLPQAKKKKRPLELLRNAREVPQKTPREGHRSKFSKSDEEGKRQSCRKKDEEAHCQKAFSSCDQIVRPDP